MNLNNFSGEPVTQFTFRGLMCHKTNWMPIYFTNYKDALHGQLRVKQNQDLSRKKLYIHNIYKQQHAADRR